jgi:predicted MFS family arabinose efflux permease
MLLLALAPGPPAFYASAIVFGLGFGLGHTGLTILTVDRAAPAERGAAMATFSLAWDAGTLGAFALGFVADAISLQALFAVAALLPAAALVGFVGAVRRERRTG